MSAKVGSSVGTRSVSAGPQALHTASAAEGTQGKSLARPDFRGLWSHRIFRRPSGSPARETLCMLTAYGLQNGRLKCLTDAGDFSGVTWIDLLSPTKEERDRVGNL